MIRNFVLAFVALSVLASCASPVPKAAYEPATKPERFEFAHDRRDVYPDDVRKIPAAFTNAPVVWVGVIRSTDAYEENLGDKILADTIFEHHYFNWVQTGHGGGVKLYVSPRGEGLFRTRWHLDKTSREASAENAEKYAGKGKLAIIYGVPESVDTNGIVVLTYRYLRVVDAKYFNTNTFDYGRMGETNAPMKGH